MIFVYLNWSWAKKKTCKMSIPIYLTLNKKMRKRRKKKNFLEVNLIKLSNQIKEKNPEMFQHSKLLPCLEEGYSYHHLHHLHYHQELLHLKQLNLLHIIDLLILINPNPYRDQSHSLNKIPAHSAETTYTWETFQNFTTNKTNWWHFSKMKVK